MENKREERVRMLVTTLSLGSSSPLGELFDHGTVGIECKS